MNDELFQFDNGIQVNDLEISNNMFFFDQEKPEESHKEDDGYTWDEIGMSRLFAGCYKDQAIFCPEAKTWYTYENGIWVKDVECNVVSNKLKNFVRSLRLYCLTIKDENKQKEYFKFVGKMGDRRFRDRILKDARDEMKHSLALFDNNPYLINCKNGTYDLQKGIFYEHRTTDYLTKMTNFEFTVQKDICCMRWLEFINEITCGDKEKADFLQRALGYSLLGKSNEETMFILHGTTTRNGKSTLLATIQHLLGDYSFVAPVELICKNGLSKNAEAPSPILVSLKGKRFVTMSESENSGKLDVSIIKQFTGGEEITARGLHMSPISFLPQFTLWLSCNDLPRVDDKSLFASDRVKVVEFDRHFNPDEQDTTLKEKFKESENMMGIFRWLVVGYEKYKKHKLKMSNDMANVIHQYAKSNDVVIQYLEARCIQGVDYKVKATDLYLDFKSWCKTNNYYVFTSRKFYLEVRSHADWLLNEGIRDGSPLFCGFELMSSTNIKLINILTKKKK